MPVFEFVCTSCGYRFEKLDRSGNAAPADCPACGSLEVNKQPSPIEACPSPGWPSTSSGGG